MECTHTSCTCVVVEMEYCSQHCVERGDEEPMADGHLCECGHPECVGDPPPDLI